MSNIRYPPLNSGCQCVTCLGCNLLSQQKFMGKYDCDNYRDGRNKEDTITKEE